MKKIFLITCLMVMVHTGQLWAQQASSKNNLITENLKWMQMSGGSYPNNINIKAVRDFMKRNKSVADAEWALVNNGFVVKFSKGQQRCRTVYNKAGDFLYCIRQYAESQMPRDVRRVVKSRYFDHTITLVEEIERPSQPLVYYIHMEDATTLVNVQVSEGEIEVVEDYIKG
jgi:hypothetical protein